MSWLRRRQRELTRYTARLFDTLYSRRDVTDFDFLVDTSEKRELLFYASVRFSGGSMLAFTEALSLEYGPRFVKLRYSYHYQAADGRLIFRYDNAPHFPHLLGFPHHKHIGEVHVESAMPPDLSDVLREIDTFLYP